MAQTKLEKLEMILRQQEAKGPFNYVVPDLWNAWNYPEAHFRRLPSHELLVNPYHFYRSLITDFILPQSQPKTDYLTSLSKQAKNPIGPGEKGGDWVQRSVIYSTMIRTSASWDHDRSFSLDAVNFDQMKETGTFVKMLALLPYIQKLGVDTMYLLPLSRFSLKDKKGDLGSPYGVASFFDLDPNLKEPMTGSKMTLEEEFQAFVEACHILGMRVTIDIIPRTNAVENDLIKDHPDWFYWIKAEDLPKYQVPKVPGLPDTLSPEPKYMKQVYESDDVRRHIALFQTDPQSADLELWKKIQGKATDVSSAIKTHYGLQIAPAFSDHINDVQPPWTDITFFRMYLDHPARNRAFLTDPDVKPYILFDTIKANLFPGQKPNEALWTLLASIIPYYQAHFGIDGARIDMGHALPKPLLKMIIEQARANDPDFAFIAEELNPDNAQTAKELGYNVIIGNGFWMQPRIWEKKYHQFVYNAPDIALPMFACAETHDTARIAARDGGKVLARMATIFNMLLPNLVPFINSGQEVYETQPMNIGIDCTDKDRFNLPQSDLFYGKLALFDAYAFHYISYDRWELLDHLAGIREIRARWLNHLMNLKHYIPLYFDTFDSPFIGVSYFDPDRRKCLIVAANTDPYQSHSSSASLEVLRANAMNANLYGNLVYATYEFGREYRDFSADGRIILHLGPGEVKIIEL